MPFLNKSNIYFEVTGNGPVLIFIHGWSHSSAIWSKVINNFSDQFKCLCIDIPGFGKSNPLERKKTSLLGYSESIKSLCKEFLGTEKAYAIISDSLGSLITLILIERFEFNPKKVILIGCPIDGLSWIIKFLSSTGVIYFLLSVMKILPSRISKYFIKNSLFFTSKHPQRIDKKVIESISGLDVFSANKILYELTKPTRLDLDLISKGHIKYCVLRGSDDILVSRSSSKILADHLNAKYLEISDSGHTPMQENPEAFVKISKQFILEK